MVKQEPKINPSSSSSKKRFKGVRMRSWGSWVSEIRAPNQKTRIWLGSYSTAEAAARAYDAALLCLKGSKANLNFPKSIPTLNLPDPTAAMSPKSIQKIAAAAAADLLESSGDLSFSSSSSELSSLSPELSSASNATEVRIEDDLISLAAADCGGGGGGGGGGDGGGDYSWYNFESPKYYDEMMNGVFYDPTMVVEDDYACGDDADIRLWSFC